MDKEILKIVFFHRARDPYTYERIKYFVNKKHIVYSIIFDLDETNPSHNDFVQYKLRSTILDKIPLVKRFIHYFELKKNSQKN